MKYTMKYIFLGLPLMINVNKYQFKPYNQHNYYRQKPSFCTYVSVCVFINIYLTTYFHNKYIKCISNFCVIRCLQHYPLPTQVPNLFFLPLLSHSFIHHTSWKSRHMHLDNWHLHYMLYTLRYKYDYGAKILKLC